MCCATCFASSLWNQIWNRTLCGGQTVLLKLPQPRTTQIPRCELCAPPSYLAMSQVDHVLDIPVDRCFLQQHLRAYNTTDSDFDTYWKGHKETPERYYSGPTEELALQDQPRATRFNEILAWSVDKDIEKDFFAYSLERRYAVRGYNYKKNNSRRRRRAYYCCTCAQVCKRNWQGKAPAPSTYRAPRGCWRARDCGAACAPGRRWDAATPSSAMHRATGRLA